MYLAMSFVCRVLADWNGITFHTVVVKLRMTSLKVQGSSKSDRQATWEAVSFHVDDVLGLEAYSCAPSPG